MAINEACQVWIEQRIKEELEDGGEKSLREIGRVIAAEIEKVFEAKVNPEAIRKKVERISGTNVPPAEKPDIPTVKPGDSGDIVREVERKAKEEREAAERRELELKLAAEKAERARLEAIERAEREKQAAIEAERRKQEEAERARLAEEARVKAENDRRAADLAHRESIHKAILEALKDKGIPPTVAPMIVSLLSTGSIPFVIIEY